MEFTPDDSVKDFLFRADQVADAQDIAETFGRRFDNEHGSLDRRSANPLDDSSDDPFQFPDHADHLHISGSDGYAIEATPEDKVTFWEAVSHANRELERFGARYSSREIYRGGQRYVPFNDFALPKKSRATQSLELMGATNRHSAYSVLMQRGVLVVDDTGRDLVNANLCNPARGRTFIPDSLDRHEVGALEDVIRTAYPFIGDEFRLQTAKAERDGQAWLPESAVAHPTAMRRFIDDLAKLELFAPLFRRAGGVDQTNEIS